MNSRRRVVITGMGAVSPIGNDAKTFCKSLVEGVSGAAEITKFDTKSSKVSFACELKNFNTRDYLDRKEEERLDIYAKLGIIAAREAISDSKISDSKIDRRKIGVIIGSGIGGITTFEEWIPKIQSGERATPYFIPKIIADSISGYVSILIGAMGPNYATVSACSTGSHAVISGYEQIILGNADAMIVGGSESSIVESALSGFSSLLALSKRNDDPQKASRPFDADRDGFVLGEGAGILVIENLETALERGAHIYAEMTGVAASGDAYHITAPHPEGKGIILAINRALEVSGVNLEDIDVINAHGTSTQLGDLAELKAIAEVFGDHISNINITANKSMIGHLLGASGVISCIAGVHSINEGVVPPTINLDKIDPAIDSRFNLTPNIAQTREVNNVLANAFGFGGHNACIILSKYQ